MKSLQVPIKQVPCVLMFYYTYADLSKNPGEITDEANDSDKENHSL